VSKYSIREKHATNFQNANLSVFILMASFFTCTPSAARVKFARALAALCKAADFQSRKDYDQNDK